MAYNQQTPLVSHSLTQSVLLLAYNPVNVKTAPPKHPTSSSAIHRRRSGSRLAHGRYTYNLLISAASRSSTGPLHVALFFRGVKLHHRRPGRRKVYLSIYFQLNQLEETLSKCCLAGEVPFDWLWAALDYCRRGPRRHLRAHNFEHRESNRQSICVVHAILWGR